MVAKGLGFGGPESHPVGDCGHACTLVSHSHHGSISLAFAQALHASVTGRERSPESPIIMVVCLSGVGANSCLPSS